jgi:release factor glutamine methyltransferase
VPTIQSRVSSAADLLRRAGVADEEAGLDARLLAQFVLGWSAVRFLADARKADSPDFAARYDALVERRARREPLAYITREREFWDLTFEVTSSVLIPRPETELVVETALNRFPQAGAVLSVADVCTGSGCVAIALARERPRMIIVATDISEEALAVARRNAERHGVQDRVHFGQADLFPAPAVGSEAEAAPRGFHLIVANPPYVPETDRAALAPEVRDYEPPVALFAEADGLSIIRRLIEQAPRHLRPGGTLMFEFGFGQADAVRRLIADRAGLTLASIEEDLQRIPRVAVATMSPEA